MPEIPAEVVQVAAEALSAHKWSDRSWAAHRSHKFDSGCAVCQGDVSAIAGVVLAAIAEQGLVIVRAEDVRGVLGPKRGVSAYISAGRRLLDAVEQPAQPSGTIQDVRPARDGMSGRSDDTNPAGTLSAPQGWTGFTDAHGRHFLRQVADNGDLLIAFRPTPIEEDWKARAEEAEEALDAAQQTIARTVRYARVLNESNPVTAGVLAAVLLNLDPRDCPPGVALRALETQGASLTEEAPDA